jgi:riboflavin synthase
MFTGIVEERGEVVAVDRHAGAATVTVRGPLVTPDAGLGDSIAVNGVCLTVTATSGPTFTADVMAETLRRTALGAHLVQGHVDAVGVIVSRSPAQHWDVVRITVPPGLARYIVEKGSVAVDGVSLTVSGVGGGPGGDPPWFEVSLIPATLSGTTLGLAEPGSGVNLEVDVIGKYVERLLAGREETVQP